VKLIKRSFLIALIAGGVSAFGISYIFNVRPIGDLKGPVVFRFYDASGRQVETNISDFAVSERTPDKRWRPVWSLVGKERVKEITYGASFPGLKETLAPKKLITGKIYGAFASDGFGGSAGRYFRFKDNGTMTLPDSPD
jgi:hypothetical protein